jgi:hypothetical protein
LLSTTSVLSSSLGIATVPKKVGWPEVNVPSDSLRLDVSNSSYIVQMSVTEITRAANLSRATLISVPFRAECQRRRDEGKVIVRVQRRLFGGVLTLALLLGCAVPAEATTHGGKAKTPATLYGAASDKTTSAQSQFYASMTTSPVISVVSKRAITLATTYTEFAKALAHIHWQGKAKKDSRTFESYLRTFSQFLLTIKLQTPSTMSSWSDQLTAIGNAGHKPFDALSEDLGSKARASTPVRGTPGVGSTTTKPSSPKVTTPPVTAPPVTAPPVTAPPVTAPPVTTPPAPALNQNAVQDAESYLSTEPGFSQQGLINQLSGPGGDGFSVADATAAVDSLNVNWNAQAVDDANNYNSTVGGFSCSGMIQQLSGPGGDGFTVAQATYGATQAGDC